MYRSAATKLLGGGKFTKRHRGDKSQQTEPASPHRSLYLNLSRPAGRRGSSGEYDTARLQVTDMSHHLKPCGTIIPLSLWREKGGGGDGANERASEKWRGGWCWWMLYSWLIQRDSPRDASRSSNKALLSLSLLPFFFFLEYCWVRSSQILWAPVFPHSHLRMPQKLSRRHLGLFRCWCFKWIIHVRCSHAEGYLGSEDGWRFNVTLAAEGMSPHLSQQAARWQLLSTAFG